MIFLSSIMAQMGFPAGSDSKESACNSVDLSLIPGWKIPWRRAWQPTPVFLPGESPRTEEPGGLHSKGVAKNQTWLSASAHREYGRYL